MITVINILSDDPIYGSLAGFFINGIINGFGVHMELDKTFEGNFVNGKLDGRVKIINKNKKTEERTYCYYENNVKLNIDIRYSLIEDGYEIMYAVDDAEYSIKSFDTYYEEYVINNKIMLFVKIHQRLNHVIGKKHMDVGHNMGIWRSINHDGTVKLGARYNRDKPTMYTTDGVMKPYIW